LEHWNICVGADPYPDDEQRFYAKMNGTDFLDAHCFETELPIVRAIPLPLCYEQPNLECKILLVNPYYIFYVI